MKDNFISIVIMAVNDEINAGKAFNVIPRCEPAVLFMRYAERHGITDLASVDCVMVVI